MRRRAVLLWPMFAVMGCTVTRLELPGDPVQMTVLQRQTTAIPGSRATVKIRLGDITARQVLLSVRGATNRPIVETRSVSEGDVVPFRLEDGEYYLRVVELHNLLVGDDFAVFEISTHPPPATHRASNRDQPR